MYKKVPTNLNFVEREAKIRDFWKENNIFEKSISAREGNRNYTFYDGPPTANGKPHIGHVLTRVIKDMIPRYHAMKGAHVLRKAGWDTHGLPVEIEVEKSLGIDGKEQIEEYGLAPFITKCKESVWKYKAMWEDFSDIVGYWVDTEHPYVTYENDYIESVWWSLKKVWERNLLYKGYKITPYCPRCGTPLSSHEVAQGYKDVKEESAIVKFKLEDENAYFLAWTTTPWTLPSNVALAVNPTKTYVKVKKNDEVYYLAEALVEKVLENEYTILEKFVGKDLEYKRYEPLFHFCEKAENAFFVTCGDFVTLEDGTGIVHMAPAFGEDDYTVGKKYNLKFVQYVNAKGELTEETDWNGIFCKKADKLILKDLRANGLLFKVYKYEHSYPHCWRCDSPLIYYARESWFIRMTEVKEDLIRNNNTINWIPENIGKGRFGDWLENIQDWSISRNRYWGTPLPVWECECGHKHAIGSISELKEMSNNCPEDIELHRPYIDEVTIKCPKCGQQMKRVEEVIDCWYDSGAMPFAQWHYPFENQEMFAEQFPADFISEAVDQTRGWFYSLLAISTLIFNKAPYRNVIVLGHVQDENGQKMSKSKGNAVDPMAALNEFGADSIRWYFYENSAPWLPNRFHKDAVVEGQRKFLRTLWNTYAFYVLYADIDKFNPTKYKLEYDRLPVMDKWLLSKLNTVVKDADNNLANYKIIETARSIQDFVDEMSNWYVRRSRERFWAKGMEQDKINAYMTLYTALVTISQVAAPMIPFMTEDIYQNLVRSVDKLARESIHLCDYPTPVLSWIDKDLEMNMELVLDVVVMGRAVRNNCSIKNRQPIGKMYVKATKPLDKFYVAIIEEELNVKEVLFVESITAFISYSLKPNFKTVGPKYGKYINDIKNALQDIDGAKAKAELDSAGSLQLKVKDIDVQLLTEDVLVEVIQQEGFASLSDNYTAVVMDTKLTPELIEEGFVREIISKIQTTRKESDFNVIDHIAVYVSGNRKIEEIFKRNIMSIKGDVLADEVYFAQDIASTIEFNINGEIVNIGLKQL
ncbi:MAG TPA: isoleucine--tRNA ligase [Bacilli bacterium]|nr:isoleucine--tRNA ligase [Bacilli bacterium]